MKVAVNPQMSTVCYSMGYRELLGSKIRIADTAFFYYYLSVILLRKHPHSALHIAKHEKSQVGYFNFAS